MTENAVDVIDIFEVARTLWSKWWLVLLGLLAGVALGFALSRLTAPVAVASSEIAAVPPRVQPRLRTTSVSDLDLPEPRGLRDVALSSRTLENARTRYEAIAAERGLSLELSRVFGTLEASVQAGAVGIVVEHEDPEVAGAFIEAWIAAIRERITASIRPDWEDVERLAIQAAEANQAWTQAEDALAEFDEASRELTLQARLDGTKGTLQSLITTRRNLELVQEDLERFQEELASSDSSSVTVRDRILLAMLDASTRPSLSNQFEAAAFVDLFTQSREVEGAPVLTASLSDLQDQTEGSLNRVEAGLNRIDHRIAEAEEELLMLAATRTRIREERIQLVEEAARTRAQYEALADAQSEAEWSYRKNQDIVRTLDGVNIMQPERSSPSLSNLALGAFAGLLSGLVASLALDRRWFVGASPE